MAQIARSFDPVDVPVASIPLPAAPLVVAVGDAPIEWSASPARALHEQLMQSFAAHPPVADDDRFPLRTRATIIVAASLVPWVVIFGAWTALA